MNKLIDLNAYPINRLLEQLLRDKTTGKNILFASDSYTSYGDNYTSASEMTVDILSDIESCDIQPRVYKPSDEQIRRTRKNAEVFTPAWIVNKMNNFRDEEWFGRSDVFNTEEDTAWRSNKDKITFSEGIDWKTYVNSRVLEITCGEAPFIVSRYDTSTGDIIPVEERTGILDRKLRVVNENTQTDEEWLEWVFKAYQSVYGYEYQGDNILIARINLLNTFIDYHKAKWHKKPHIKDLRKLADVICWNFWQMDGLTETTPGGVIKELSLFDMNTDGNESKYCKIYDWENSKEIIFEDIKKRENTMRFNFIIGNPPYQEEQISNDADGSLKNYAPPVYNIFMNEAYKIADRVELIHPARFLFDAGSTPKDWNRKMLDDVNFKILHYEPVSANIFPNTDIKGGLVISYHDTTKNFGAIKVYSVYPEMNEILKKVTTSKDYESIDKIVFSRTSFRFTQKLHDDYPEAEGYLSKGHMYDVSSNIFQRIPFVFLNEPNDDSDYVKVLGRDDNKRVIKYIKKEYINKGKNLDEYKLFVPQASGSGEFGETIGSMEIGYPDMAATETFLSIGAFSEEQYVLNVEKYMKTKFLRSLRSLLKVTQIGNKPVYRFIPIQDFSSSSDIDWSQSVSEIDKQLYKKYDLDQEEVDFIETHVKEME